MKTFTSYGIQLIKYNHREGRASADKILPRKNKERKSKKSKKEKAKNQRKKKCILTYGCAYTHASPEAFKRKSLKKIV